MEQDDLVHVRLECLRYAIEFGTARDVVQPDRLADRYFEWVMQGSESHRPVASRKDDSPTRAKKSRGVRKGSTPQLV